MTTPGSDGALCPVCDRQLPPDGPSLDYCSPLCQSAWQSGDPAEQASIRDYLARRAARWETFTTATTFVYSPTAGLVSWGPVLNPVSAQIALNVQPGQEAP